MIIARRKELNSILSTRSYHSADCDTDHALVCSKVRLQPRKFHHAKRAGPPRIDTVTMNYSSLVDKYVSALKKAVQNLPEDDATARWNSMRDTIFNTALNTFGKKKSSKLDWFSCNLLSMKPVIEAKRAAHLEHKKHPCPSTLAKLRNARRNVQRTARRCANEYWTLLCEDIEQSAMLGHIRDMYNGIKKAVGPSAKGVAPLKSLSGEKITDRGKQMERWVEHYSELYSRETMVSDAALENIQTLSIMDELDAMPSLEELSEAIDALPSEKAPGSDSIPPEAIKKGKDALLQPLHKLLCLCWEEGSVPQDMRDATVVTLYKNKGDRSDCNNYRGISLLSIVGKLFARIVLKRLQKLAERVYPESQCGFRSNRSTVDMIFSIRQLQEKCKEQGQPLYMMFIDLTKAFDLVSRKGLFSVLEKIGCPPKLLSMIMSFHTDMRGTIMFDGSTSDPFEIKSGVKQGCVLAPTLFGIFFSLLLSHAFDSSDDGIFIRTRSDGKLFNLARLRAKSKVRQVLLREMLFADDAALVTHSQEALQRLSDRFADACKQFGLTISLKKTNICTQHVNTPVSITIDGVTMENVDTFTYLGSIISNTTSLDSELDRRLGKANSVMARLSKRVWENNALSVNTKIRVYHACVLSTLLYSSECWPTYMKQERRLNTFHMRCLKRILGIKWQDHITYQEILKRAKSQSMHSLLTQRRLRWLGHVHRMADGRLPKDVLYGELSEGKRKVGRPQLRFTDTVKRDMKACDIPTDSWESLVTDRDEWRHTVRKGIETADRKRGMAAEEKRIQRKNKTVAPTHFICPNCSRDCHSRIGLLSHSRRCRVQPN